jgi:mannose-6-phosphate isomerase-like protein (cupin superfamily)
MAERKQHVVHLLIRRSESGQDHFLVHPQPGWKSPEGSDYLTLPAKRTVTDPLAPYRQGTPLDHFVDAILQGEMELADEDYVLEAELSAVPVRMASPVHNQETEYMVYPLDVWVAAEKLDSLAERNGGKWLTTAEACADPQMSPSSLAVFQFLHEQGGASLSRPAGRATMDGLALKWLGHNLDGVRHLPKQTLDRILDAGNRAFNLRVADPYLRYQMQGVGFTWSFFTEEDRQDIHVHGAHVVEIYGVLEGEMEIWSKPYYERGTSAWSHRILGPGDWVEVDSLQCHLVHWLGKGKGVVFKAGPGSLAGVGRIGEKGKTPCAECPCRKPPEVLTLEQLLSGK